MTLEEVIADKIRDCGIGRHADLAEPIANAVRAFLGSDAGSFSEMSTQGLADQCRMQARANLDPEYSRFMVAVANRLSSIGGE